MNADQAHPLLVAFVVVGMCMVIPVIGWAMLPFALLWFVIVLVITIVGMLTKE